MISCAHIFRPKDFVLAIIELDLFTNSFEITDSRNGFLFLVFNTIKNDFTIPQKETVSSLWTIYSAFSIKHILKSIVVLPVIGIFCSMYSVQFNDGFCFYLFPLDCFWLYICLIWCSVLFRLFNFWCYRFLHSGNEVSVWWFWNNILIDDTSSNDKHLSMSPNSMQHKLVNNNIEATMKLKNRPLLPFMDSSRM